MEGRLDEADSAEIALLGALKDRFHQLPAYAAILRGGIDCDRSNAGDCRPLIQAVAADDLTVAFRDHAIEVGVRKHLGEQASPGLGRRKVWRETMRGVDSVKCFVADLAANRGIFWLGNPHG